MNLSTNLTKFTLSSGLTYGYVYIPPHSAKTTILFLHGFPSGAYDWRHQIPYFSAAGYGVIIPDLLGYGSTDKPKAAEAYRGKKMASEIIEILDHEKISKVHGVGHDWGSYLLSRLANYHSNRFFSFSFLDVAYMPPGIKFDVEAANAESKAEVGYERLGFWKFLIEDDAVAILKEHFDSLHSLFYPADPPMWKQHLGPSGAMRAWLEANKIGPLAPYVTVHEKETHRSIFLNDYEAPTKWYHAYMGNMNEEDEKLANLDPKLDLPVLMITANQDIVATSEMMEKGIRHFADNVRVKKLNTGHWVQLEAREEVNKYLNEFFSELD